MPRRDSHQSAETAYDGVIYKEMIRSKNSGGRHRGEQNREGQRNQAFPQSHAASAKQFTIVSGHQASPQ
jgi:hypothetical protein